MTKPQRVKVRGTAFVEVASPDPQALVTVRTSCEESRGCFLTS